MDVYEKSLEVHERNQGKLEVRSLVRVESPEDLALAYTPGVAGPCRAIAADGARAWDLTWRGRTVAVVSDGSAVLGLGDIGPAAALPVMEGKAILFKQFAGIDAVPVVIDSRDPEQIVRIVRAIAPTFGGINLEDISAPRCFAIEAALRDIGIPVLHDDQDGTAIVLLAAMMNAARVKGCSLAELSVVVSGAGAAGRAITLLLTCRDQDERCIPVRRLRVCDSRGLLYPGRPGNDAFKEDLARLTNPEGERGSLKDALRGADVFVGVSRGGLLRAEDVRSMARDPIVLAMANPVPEIMPEEAEQAGALIVGTGRSDYPNQINNVLAFPGLFRGALEARAKRFTNAMKFAAVEAIAGCVEEPTRHHILPPPFDLSVAVRVAEAVAAAARTSSACSD
ncbi:MAG: NADP-dependent malic enzyme [Candidatus Dadabacteria bacterium]|nr:MAG: NADP-dependent malic enzyme [Candidatus Dadabacteria bacterium]